MNAHARGRFGLVGLIGLYLVITIGQSCLKLLWGDELITFYVARQNSFAGIWAALQSGADPNPPMMSAAVMLSTRWLGMNNLAVRLPSLLLGLLAVCGLWWILRRHVSAFFAAVGVLAFMTTRGFDYSYDARSYAGLLGFSVMSLVFWLKAQELQGVKRGLVLAGLVLALAGGLSANYYGVLGFFPIAFGELTDLWQRRRLRWDIWLSLLVGAVPLLIYLPLIRHNIAEFGPHAWNRPQLNVIGMSYLELVEGIFWPVSGFALWLWSRRRTLKIALPAREIAAVWTLLLYPLLGFGLAVGGAGMISPRCVVPVCCGFGLAAGLLAARIVGKNQRAGVALLGLLVVWVLAREGFCASLLLKQRHSFLALRDQVNLLQTKQILVADSSFVLPLAFYSGEGVRSKLVVPIDFAAIDRVEKDDSGEENLWGGRKGVFPFRVIKADKLVVGRPLLVIERPGGWLAQVLQTRGLTFDVVGDTADWDRVGAVFTPMAHPETRFLMAK